MKNGNRIFQIILSIAVVALFVLHFTCQGPCTTSGTSTSGTNDSTSATIVYIRLDSLLSKYELHREFSQRIETKGRRIQEDLGRREENVMQERQILQEAAPGLTAAQLRSAQQDYMRVEQGYLAYQQQVMAAYRAEEDSLTGIVQSDIDSVVAELQSEMGFEYLLQYEGTLMYGNDAKNITTELVRRLNEAYRNKQEEE